MTDEEAVLELQKNRLQSLQNSMSTVQHQSERMLISQTLFFTAYYTLLPTLLEQFLCHQTIWFFTAFLTLTVICSLLLTLISQIGILKTRTHCFRREKPTSISQNAETIILNLQTEIDHCNRALKFRGPFLQGALFLFIFSIITSLIFIVHLCCIGV